MIIDELMVNGAAYAMAGAFAGLMSGLLGIGGGLVIVPALAFIFQKNHYIPENMIMHFSAGSSLVIMIFTSQSSVRAHYRLGNILWPVFQRIWPGITVGTVLGAILAEQLPSHGLKIIFGVFLLFVACNQFASRHKNRRKSFPSPRKNNLVSCLIGLNSGLLGIGGGSLVIPYLTYCGVNTRKIIPISGLASLSVAIVGGLAFMMTGSTQAGLPPASTGYVYWPAVLWIALPSMFFAPIGARLMYLVPLNQLRNAFIVFLLLTAIDMLI